MQGWLSILSGKLQMESSRGRRTDENRVEDLDRAGILWHHKNSLVCSAQDCEINENDVRESSLAIQKVPVTENDLNRDWKRCVVMSEVVGTQPHWGSRERDGSHAKKAEKRGSAGAWHEK